MTEKVSEPIRLRIASRASCILSLRSSEKVSLIGLPCECYGGAFAAVRIAQLDQDRRALLECVDGHPCQAGGPIVALQFAGIWRLSHHHRHAFLHSKSIYEELFFLFLVSDPLQRRRSNVHLGCQSAKGVQSSASDDVAAEIVNHLDALYEPSL